VQIEIHQRIYDPSGLPLSATIMSNTPSFSILIRDPAEITLRAAPDLPVGGEAINFDHQGCARLRGLSDVLLVLRRCGRTVVQLGETPLFSWLHGSVAARAASIELMLVEVSRVKA